MKIIAVLLCIVSILAIGGVFYGIFWGATFIPWEGIEMPTWLREFTPVDTGVIPNYFVCVLLSAFVSLIGRRSLWDELYDFFSIRLEIWQENKAGKNLAKKIIQNR